MVLQLELFSSCPVLLIEFHGLPIGESDPEDCVHPNCWKTIDQIKERVLNPEVKNTKRVISAKVHWKDDMTTFNVCKKMITGHCG